MLYTNIGLIVLLIAWLIAVNTKPGKFTERQEKLKRNKEKDT
jgi:hypothetical protein